MQTRLAVLASVLLAACYGCATEEQPQSAGAAPAATHPKGPVYRTGSRLPPMDDDVGTAAVNGVSKDDYINDRNSTMSPTRGN